eukprot:CAMPEP_0172561826 /NCGR_PEP_ID=MMETSP1067-20121228/94483_1 /TAXON_ID=265564 ORGANISM="Thalassiosira punctigera, Strain Tpunct2005C2" /NCGR_SAMPLE_ID=MMETSP1067 /ASSEMBLY_ACC=CAM_ASM_000444 /LENGTH=55 /DNA_ID=CAMNT_0013351949 /DNA_START=56 /DNA_END=220 /DNA_ORIENTATION=-
MAIELTFQPLSSGGKSPGKKSKAASADPSSSKETAPSLWSRLAGKKEAPPPPPPP